MVGLNRFMSWLLVMFVATVVIFLSILVYVMNDIHHFSEQEMPQIETEQEIKKQAIEFDDSVFSLMNKNTDDIKDLLGEPVRKDPSAYGYTWWIYNEEATYLQLGIQDEEVITVYAAGDDLESDPISIGDTYNDLLQQFDIERKVTYEKGISHYTFLLSETDVRENPLIQLDHHLFVQPHIDTFTQEVSSLRIMTGDLLTLQRFYEMEYRGTLPEDMELTDQEWQAVQKGMEKQILDMTNVLRKRHDLQQVSQDEVVSEVAYMHSKDMHDQQYFSHESKDGRGLKERLESENVYYVGAGENIAAQHSDALAAMQGWLNSEGHRETLLNEQYNYLGVGVHRLYYTQNFILKH